MLLIGSLGAMWAWWGKQFHEPKCGSGHVCRFMAWTRHQCLVPYINFEKVHGDLCLFVAASHQTLDTWSKAQRPIKVGIKGRGRSGTSRDSNPAGLCCSSAEAHTRPARPKIPSAPSAFPFFGRLRRQAITPPKGYKPGGMAPWGRRKSPVPRHTRQNRPEVRRPTECNPRTGEERPHTNTLQRPRGPLYLSLRPTNARIWHKAVFKVGPVAEPKPTRVRQGQKYLRPRRHSPFWGASGARQ